MVVEEEFDEAPSLLPMEDTTANETPTPVGSLNEVPETDEWSDTPLSALKDDSTSQDQKSSIDAIIKSVVEADEPVEPSDTCAENAAESSESAANSSAKEEKSEEPGEDDSSAPKSTQSTPQSTKAKRRPKAGRSKVSK